MMTNEVTAVCRKFSISNHRQINGSNATARAERVACSRYTRFASNQLSLETPGTGADSPAAFAMIRVPV